MSAQSAGHVAAATIRLSVVGPAGQADLAVPLWMDAASILEAYSLATGHVAVPGTELTTSAGRPLAAERSIEQLEVDHGDVLVVALDGTQADDHAAGGSAAAAAGAGTGLLSGRARSVLVAVASACGVGSALGLAFADGSVPVWVRVVCLGLLLLSGVAAAFPYGGRRSDGARIRSAASPAFGAAAGFALGYTPGPGGLLLGLAVAALAAVVFAALARAFLADEDDDLIDVWLVVGAFLAVLAATLLMIGSAATSLLAVAYAAAIVAARLLPYVVVDVPDEALLDLDRLAVTAWSAREQARAGRRRTMVRPEGVRSVVTRGQRLVSAGTVVIALVVVVAGPVLVRAADRDLRGYGSLALVGLGAVALALVARSFRSVVPRLALRLAALGTAASLGAMLLLDGGSTLAWTVFVGAAVLGGLVVTTALSLGRGWRSVWWARVADVVEALSVVLVVAALPFASGLVAAVRGFTS